MLSLPIVQNVTLSPMTVSENILPLIASFRPDWNSHNTRLVSFTKGITNSMFGLFNTRTPVDESEALVIKIYGAQTEFLINRQDEIETMVTLAKHHFLDQKCLIQFNNGIIYEYAPGINCSLSDVRKENIASLIATKMGQLHSIPVQQNEQPFTITFLHKMIDLLKENKVPIEEWSNFASDVGTIVKSILPRLLPHPQIGKDLVFCHNDTYAPNIIVNVEKNAVSFIDFEYSHFNYALFDVASHFVGYGVVEKADFLTSYPSREEQQRWLKIYYRARGMDEILSNATNCHLIDQFSVIVHLTWGFWGLVQSHISNIDYDYNRHAKVYFECYQKKRSLLFN